LRLRPALFPLPKTAFAVLTRPPGAGSRRHRLDLQPVAFRCCHDRRTWCENPSRERSRATTGRRTGMRGTSPLRGGRKFMGRRRINFREGGTTSPPETAPGVVPPPQNRCAVLTRPPGAGFPPHGLGLWPLASRCGEDREADAVEVLHHIAIPKADYFV